MDKLIEWVLEWLRGRLGWYDEYRKVPPLVVTLIAVIVALAWAGPSLRQALAGKLHHVVALILAYAYAVVVAFAFAVLVLALLWPGLRAAQRRTQFIATTKIVGRHAALFSSSIAIIADLSPTNQPAAAMAVLKEMVVAAAEVFTQTPGRNRAVLYVPDGDHLVPYGTAHHNFSPDEVSQLVLPLSHGSVAGHVFLSGEHHLAQPAWPDVHFYPVPDGRPPAAILSVPVLDYDGDSIAVLSVDCDRTDVFLEENASHLQVVTSRISDIWHYL